MSEPVLAAVIASVGAVLAALIARPTRNRRQKAAYRHVQRLCPHVESRATRVDGEIMTRIESRIYRVPGAFHGVCGFCGGVFDPNTSHRLAENWRDLIEDDSQGSLRLLEKQNRRARRARKRCDRLGGPPE